MVLRSGILGLLVLLLLLQFNFVFPALSDDADLLKAAANGDIERVRHLLDDKKASLSTKNNNGVSAILFAANNGHAQVVADLLRRGANIEDRSNNGKTPLLWASLWGHYDVVSTLVDRGANLSAHDIYGLTPIMSAVMCSNVPILQLLMDKGANITARNHYNGTAYTIAKTKYSPEVLRLLRPHFTADDDDRTPYQVLLDMIRVQFQFYLRLLWSEVQSILGLAVYKSPSEEL